MSDTDDAFSPGYLDDRQRRQAAYSTVTSVDADPDKAARAIDLGQATDTNPSLIYPDMENFEKQHKAMLNSSLTMENRIIQSYLNSHPLAAAVSNDDLANLDELGDKVTQIGEKSPFLKWVQQYTPYPLKAPEPFTAEGTQAWLKSTSIADSTFTPFMKAFGDQPFGQSSLQRPTDLEYALAHPVNAAVVAGLMNMFDIPMELMSRTFSGLLAVVGETGGRDLASMIEYNLMKPEGGHKPSSAREYAKDVMAEEVKAEGPTLHPKALDYAEAAIAAAPWIKEGKMPPYGIHPLIDKEIERESKESLGKLDDALRAATSTNTRERSPDMLANFAKDPANGLSIQVPAAAVRKLYGEKSPEAEDNVLGWVPNLAEQLESAEPIGGDVSIPLHDWLARVDPEIAKELHDDIRVQPHGVTNNEIEAAKEYKKAFPEPAETEIEPADPDVERAKPLKLGGPIAEPLPQTRASSGLEPMFSIGDRKLTLKRREIDPDETGRFGPAQGFHDFDLLDENDKAVGHVTLSEQKGGKQLYIEMIQGGYGLKQYDPNAFGPALMRNILRQIKAEFPDAESLTGHRVSGAREKAGTWETKAAMPTIKFDELDNPTVDLRKLFAPQWQTIAKGVEALIPSDSAGPKFKQLEQAIKDELHRMIPGVDTNLVHDIYYPEGGSSVKGVYIQSGKDLLPQVFVSMEAGDKLGVARHEAIHHLRRMGFFTPAEWTMLERAAQEGKWKERYSINQRYPNLPEPYKLEEAIAEGYKYWKSGELILKDTGPFQKLKDFIEAIRLKFKEILGQDFTWDELFQRVDQGEVGRRDFDSAGAERDMRQREASASNEPELPAAGTTRMEDRPLFRTPGTVGMTAKQMDLYNRRIKEMHDADIEWSRDRAEKDQRKRQTSEWKENYKTVRGEVSQSMEARPDVGADQLFGAGILYGEKVTKPKLDASALTKEQKAMLPKEYYGKDGINPDDAAGLFGYSSGDAMVERLGLYNQAKLEANMSSKAYLQRIIDQETERQMQTRFGNLEANILDSVKEQVTSETQLNLLAEDTLALGIRAGAEASFDKKQFTGFFQDAFAKTSLAQARSDTYLKAAGRAGQAAEVALLKGEFDGAFRAKQQQFGAVVMAKEAIKLEKARDQFDRQAKRLQKREIPSIEQEYLNFTQLILAKVGRYSNIFDLQNRIGRITEYSTLNDFVRTKADGYGEGTGRPMPIADWLLQSTDQKEFESLTTSEFYDVQNAIKSLVKQGRDEKKIIKEGDAADLRQTINEMGDQLKSFPEKDVPIDSRQKGPLNAINTFRTSLINAETVLNRWDRDDPRGVFNRWIVYPLARAANYKYRLDREFSKDWRSLGKVADKDKLVDSPLIDPLTRTPDNPDGRPYIGFDRNHVMAMLANAGNEGNWRVLTKGHGIDDPNRLMQWLFQNTTKADWDRQQAMGDVFEKAFKMSETVYENITGVAPERIPLRPIETPFGTYPGWYHPLIYSRTREGTSKKLMGRDPLDQKIEAYASIANGYTKKRTGYTAPLELNFDLVPAKLGQMLHDIAFRQTIIETSKVFKDKEFRAQMTRRYGPMYKDGFDDYLRDVASGTHPNGQAAAVGAQTSEYFRQNVIGTYIGFNPYTVLKHGPTAWVTSMTEVGPINFAKAFIDLNGRSEETSLSNWEFVHKHSEEIQRRERNWQETVAGATKSIEGDPTIRERILQAGSVPVAWSDMISATPTWLAAYRKAKEEGQDHGQSVDEGNRAVRRAHGSTATTNQPAIVRGGGAGHGWLTSLYGFFGTQMQRRVEIAYQLNDMYKLGRDAELRQAMGRVPKLTSYVLAYVVLPTMIEEWVTGLNEEDRRGWGQRVLSGTTGGVASSFVYIRDLVHAFRTGQEPSVGLIGGPLHDVSNVVRDLEQGKRMFSKEHAGKMVGDTLTLLGDTTGVAPKIMGSAVRFGIDIANRQQKPKTAPDWLRGATRGTTKVHEVK